MSLKCKGIFVIGAKRTPFCKHGGSLRELPASYAFAAAAKDAIQSARLDPMLIDNTVVGNVNFLSQCDGGKTPRYCGIYSGVPIERPALGVNKACGTGLQAIITGAVDILIGSSRIALTGGTEIMSALPYLVRNIRFGGTLGASYSYQFEDYIKTELMDSYTGLSMQRLAEELGMKYGVTRKDADEYAAESLMKWQAAQNSKTFKEELTSLTVTLKTKEVEVDRDDIPSLSAEDLAKMPAILEKGTLTSTGNSAAPADGAAALLIADEAAVNQHDLTPLARVSGWSCVGVDPMDVGLGAVVAVKKLLGDHRLTVEDVDLFEINETFAVLALVAATELSVPRSKLNVNGGAVAAGHPVAATGARMVTHLVHQMRRRNLKKAVAASSCGGGQGIAIMLESV